MAHVPGSSKTSVPFQCSSAPTWDRRLCVVDPSGAKTRRAKTVSPVVHCVLTSTETTSPTCGSDGESVKSKHIAAAAGDGTEVAAAANAAARMSFRTRALQDALAMVPSG